MDYTFTNEAGTTLDLDDGTTYKVIERTGRGFGLSPLSVTGTTRSNRVGMEMRGARITPRTVSMEVLVSGGTHSNTMSNIRALIKHVAGSYGRSEPRFGTLNVTQGGSTRKLRCIGRTATKDSVNMLSATYAIVELSFFAPHPHWYVDTEQTDTITIGSGTTPSWPFTWPVTWGLDGFSGGATIANNGDVETRSLMWEVDGPCESPALFNTTVDQYVRLENLVVPSGLTLRVRMGWRPDGVAEHRAVLVDGSGAESSVMGWLESGASFFHLDPGNNVINASQDNEAATVHTLKWYHEYLSQ